jgi:hypothetical protein
MDNKMTDINVPSVLELAKRFEELENKVKFLENDNIKLKHVLATVLNELKKNLVQNEPKEIYTSFVVKLFEEEPEGLESFKVLYRPNSEEKVVFVSNDEVVEIKSDLKQEILTTIIDSDSENEDKDYFVVVYGVAEEKEDESVGKST